MQPDKNAVLPGTLEMLILATLRRESLHGYAISQRIQQNSNDFLSVEEGSLYPALQRLLMEGWVSAKWGTSARNRRVRVYTLTSSGRKQLSREVRRVNQVMEGIAGVLRPSET